ncbi:MAG TPA: endoribonuclease MazF [Candidatus Acidoferrales bacterium]|nr:endoribonuclease MazF [Candidatus Acidoferrales bacterium]
MTRGYVPEAGDIVWLNFNPQAGHEQAGHRPALVLSPAAYNAKTSLMLCCPMTTQIKGYPFEVLIAGPTPNAVPSAVLADQVKSLDWRKRRARRKAAVASHELAEVRAKLRALLG